MRPVQYFSEEYLEQCRQATPEAIVEYLESFRLMQNSPADKSKLISLKVPQPLLDAFRHKCQLANVKYQTEIKLLMEAWVRGHDPSETP